MPPSHPPCEARITLLDARSGLRRHLRSSRKAGFVAAVSDLALIIMAAPDISFAHDGIKPHRINDNSRRGSFGF
jgi:hypothetical protein